MAEQGGRLSVVDPAFKPVVPTGPGKTIVLLAGMVLFLSLGIAFAVGLAVIDDRLYRRADIDELGIPVLAVIPPPAKQKPREHTQKEAA
jgi:capsular polysaccharide biosynthesis protein